jgi:hypothetical protein
MDFTLFHALLFVHILAAAIWIGGALVGMLIGIMLAKQGDADVMSRFCIAFATIAGPVFGGSALVVLGTGIWMVADSPIEFGALWVSLGFAGWLVATVMGATIVGMTWTRVGTLLQEPGATIEGVQRTLTKAVRFTWLDLIIRIAVVLIMVWRPT